MNLLKNSRRKHKKRGRKRRGTVIPFLIASILLHLFLFLIALLYLIYSQDKHAAKPKEKPKFIEITELPVPKEKETEPPKEVKRYAERSRQVPEEKTKDDFTKRGSVSTIPQTKQREQAKQAKQPKQSEEVKTAREKLKKEEVKKKPRQTASLPKEVEKDLESPRKELEEEKLPEISKEDLFSALPPQSSREEQSSKDFLGSRDAEKKEDTVDLNTTEYRYLSYFLKLKRQIEGVWNYPEVSQIRGEQGELFLIFTIRRDGYLEDVNLIDSSGYTRLDDEALRAIRVASPFSPFPESWNLERLNVRAAFRYQISYGWSVR